MPDTTSRKQRPQILLLGKNGQLGWELQRTLQPLGIVHALDYPEIDLTRPDTLDGIFQEIHPAIIVNATAYTAVDQAESKPDVCMSINAQAPGIMAEAAAELGSVFIHYSTDYVFDGEKGSPYVETDSPNPLNIYGQSKLSGEKAVSQAGGASLVLRTSWVYSLRRDSFVTKVLQWARQQPQLSIVSDQIGNPTWARALAEISAQVLAIASAGSQAHAFEYIQERRGIYHLAGSGMASRLEWAQAILKYDHHPQEQKARHILPARSADFPTPAQRPLFSALDCSKFESTFGLALPDWQIALELAMAPQTA